MEIEAKLREKPEIYYNFLLQLDDKDLINMCQVDKTIKSYYGGNYLWSLKINKLYLDFPIPIQYKNNIRTLYYLLKYLTLFDIIRLAIDIGDIKLLDWLWTQDLDFDAIMNEIDGDKNIEIDFEERIGKGDKKIEIWALEHNFDIDYHYVAENAAKNNNFTLLEELAQKGFYPGFMSWEWAAVEGNLDILKWMHQRNDKINIETNYNDDVITVAKFGYVDIVRWFIEEIKIVATVMIANAAASRGRINVLNYLAVLDIYPDDDGWNWAFGNFQYEVLAWMSAKKRIFVISNEQNDPIEMVEYYVEYDDIQNAKRLLDCNFYPRQFLINEKAIDSVIKSITLLNILAEYNIYPNRTAANLVIKNGDYKMLQWLLEHHIFPII